MGAESADNCVLHRAGSKNQLTIASCIGAGSKNQLTIASCIVQEARIS